MSIKIAKINNQGLLHDAIVQVLDDNMCTILMSSDIALIGSRHGLDNMQYTVLKKCKFVFNQSITAYIISSTGDYSHIIINQYDDERVKKIMYPLYIIVHNDSIMTI